MADFTPIIVPIVFPIYVKQTETATDYGGGVPDPIGQLYMATSRAGNALVQPLSSGFIWGQTSYYDGNWQLDNSCVEFKGTGLTYSGGLPAGGKITSISILGDSAVLGSAGAVGALDKLEITGLNIDISNGTFGQQAINLALQHDNYSELANLLFAKNWSYTGSFGNDRVTSGNGNDTLRGNSGNDVLEGGQYGNDKLDGGMDGDWMFGHHGNDTYYVDNVGDLVGEDPNTGASGIDTVIASKAFSLGSTTQIRGAVENLTLAEAAGNVIAQGNELANTIVGNSGYNSIYGYGGNDILKGGDGGDNFTGGVGADQNWGGKGSDVYYLDNVYDSVNESGGDGIDQIYATFDFSLSNTLRIRGDVEYLRLTGVGSIDGTGNALNNLITGTIGENVMSGLGGIDRLAGGGGKDVLIGGTGADDLYAVGLDGVRDGIRDTFKYTSIADSGVAASTRDDIYGFLHGAALGADRIDLSTIDANPLAAGNQAFRWIGTGAFTATGVGEVRTLDLGTRTLVYVDTDSDSGAEMTLLVHDVATLASYDFIL